MNRRLPGAATALTQVVLVGLVLILVIETWGNSRTRTRTRTMKLMTLDS
jgi:hypothetical protein